MEYDLNMENNFSKDLKMTRKCHKMATVLIFLEFRLNPDTCKNMFY